VSGRRTFLSFQSKILLSVVVLMVSLTAVTLWLLNRRITERLEPEAAHNLLASEGLFKRSQNYRVQNLLLRLGEIPNAPRFKAVLQTRDPKTIRFHLAELLDEQKADLGLFSDEQGAVVAAAKRDSGSDLREFEAVSLRVLEQAMEGQPSVDTVVVDGKLFTAVSIPVTIGSANNIMGALVFAVEFGEQVAQELAGQLSRSELVFLANGQVVASTLDPHDLNRELTQLHPEGIDGWLSGTNAAPRAIRQIRLHGEHFSALVARFPTLDPTAKLGYLLLSSYEPALRELRATQRLLFLVWLVGTALSTAFIAFIVRKLTQPLRQLRDSAEAVGQGDFSKRVPVQAGDECGELASVFNRMTENLQTSRAELEQAMENLRTTQAQLIQREKLSAIGEFVAGVTHELNNPLTGLIGFAELLQQTSPDERHQRYVTRIVSSAQRCHKIVQNLLSFARQHPPERKLVQMNDLIESALDILRYEMRTSNIEVITELDPNLPKTMADPHQMQQVFVNLINNARQAMEESKGRGVLSIRSAVKTDCLHLEFKDDGPGISEEGMKKIFQPFFTTKPVGKGTGLGLSLSYGLIREHGGNISVESKPGLGATFTIDLPITASSPTLLESSVTPRPAVCTRGDGRKHRVLLVDDEEMVLDVAREVLTSQGYDVATAQDGESALRHLREECYDLTICDWKMPGLNGQDVFERLHAADPKMADRFIFMTGDVVNPRTQEFLERQNKICLSKPFSMVEFRSAVDRLVASA
jgi:signal transduction histidine kinase